MVWNPLPAVARTRVYFVFQDLYEGIQIKRFFLT